ncbi:MAG: hypothetical protein KF742_06465 [Cryobacterium sp.]|nr:hypothetical protein [Cryobacterium sp.]
MKRIKFQTKAHAAEMMQFAIADGYAAAWNISGAGHVRFLCARCRLWLDVNEATFKAWKYAY